MSNPTAACRRLAAWFSAVLLVVTIGCGRGDRPAAEPESGDDTILVKQADGRRTTDDAESLVFHRRPRPTAAQLAQIRAPVDQGFGRLPRIEPLPSFRDWGIRETTIDALGRIGEAAVPALVDALQDPDPILRADAARGLARLGPMAKVAIPELIVALSDPEERVRENAVRALGQIGPDAAAAVPALMETLRTADDADRSPAPRGR